MAKAKTTRPRLSNSSADIAAQISATQQASAPFVEQAPDGKTATPKATEMPSAPISANTRVIEQVVFPKAPNKNNWTKVSPKVRPDVARAIAYLMQVEAAQISSVQDVFERYTFDPIIEAAKEHGFIPDPD